MMFSAHIYPTTLQFSKVFEYSNSNRTRGHNLSLDIPLIQTNIRRNFFAFYDLKPWNSLPLSVVNAPSKSSFKSRLDEVDQYSLNSHKISLYTAWLGSYYIFTVASLISILCTYICCVNSEFSPCIFWCIPLITPWHKHPVYTYTHARSRTHERNIFWCIPLCPVILYNLNTICIRSIYDPCIRSMGFLSDQFLFWSLLQFLLCVRERACVYVYTGCLCHGVVVCFKYKPDCLIALLIASLNVVFIPTY